MSLRLCGNEPSRDREGALPLLPRRPHQVLTFVFSPRLSASAVNSSASPVAQMPMLNRAATVSERYLCSLDALIGF